MRVARGAHILAEVSGYGFTADAYHMTQPDNDGVGAQACMRAALASAGIAPSQVGYINAHGTSTPFNDKIETKAIREVFGPYADALAVSSTKSMVGHLLGAAGGVEGAVTVLALHDGVLPPTINLENPDPECDLNYLPGQRSSSRSSTRSPTPSDSAATTSRCASRPGPDQGWVMRLRDLWLKVVSRRRRSCPGSRRRGFPRRSGLNAASCSRSSSATNSTTVPSWTTRSCTAPTATFPARNRELRTNGSNFWAMRCSGSS